MWEAKEVAVKDSRLVRLDTDSDGEDSEEYPTPSNNADDNLFYIQVLP